MADSFSSSDESQNETEAEVLNVDDSGSDASVDELLATARQNEQFEQLKSQRKEFSFENLSSVKNSRKRKHEGETSNNKTKVKKKVKSATKKPASNSNTAQKAAPKVNRNGTSKSSSASRPSTTIADHTTKKREWKPKSLSKTNYFMKYFKINADAKGSDMTAVCNLCNSIVSGKMGNNSNLKSHLK